jgi:hypothetical protein
LALRIYREENGDWPPQLEALTPGILERLPADPRSGRAFGYERTPTGWRLWSPEREPARLEDQSAREADGRLVFEALDD